MLTCVQACCTTWVVALECLPSHRHTCKLCCDLLVRLHCFNTLCHDAMRHSIHSTHCMQCSTERLPPVFQRTCTFTPINPTDLQVVRSHQKDKRYTALCAPAAVDSSAGEWDRRRL